MKLGRTRLLPVCQTQVDWRGPSLASILGNLGDLLAFNVVSRQGFCLGLRISALILADNIDDDGIRVIEARSEMRARHRWACPWSVARFGEID